MSVKEKQVDSSFVGLPPRPRSLCGLDQMTNYVVLAWYLILITKYCGFKGGEHMRSYVPFVRFFNPCSIGYYAWKSPRPSLAVALFSLRMVLFFDSTCVQYA